MNDQDTNRLLELAAAGSHVARSRLLERHRDRLRRMVAAFMDPRISARVDPSDVLQDALTNAALRLSDYLAQRPIAFYPWLRQIVKEQLIGAHQRYEAAESHWRIALQIFEKLHDTSNILFTKNELAKVFWETGRQEQSIATSEQVLQMQNELFGDSHPSALDTLANLAPRKSYMGDTEGAIKDFRTLVDARRMKYGPRHERSNRLLGQSILWSAPI